MYEKVGKEEHRWEGKTKTFEILHKYNRDYRVIFVGDAAMSPYELLQVGGVADLTGLEVVVGASGTDLHLIAGQLLGGTKSLPGLAVMVDAVETGSCVPAALAGRHFSDRAAQGETVSEGTAVASGPAMEVVSVALRNGDGTPRPADSIDAEVTALVASAAAEGRRLEWPPRPVP